MRKFFIYFTCFFVFFLLKDSHAFDTLFWDYCAIPITKENRGYNDHQKNNLCKNFKNKLYNEDAMVSHLIASKDVRTIDGKNPRVYSLDTRFRNAMGNAAFQTLNSALYSKHHLF